MQPTKKQISERQDFFEIISISDPTTIIPVLEKGIEFMELISSDEKECNDSLRDSRVLVAFLRAQRLGRLRKQLLQ
jgi:hypothetical protein